MGSASEVLPTKLRISLRDAAIQLGMHPETLRKLAVEQGEFAVLRNRGGPKQGRRVYLKPAEISVFAQGGVEALREYRAQARRRSKAL
jgi:hypothetical protein